jgi:arylsulfatase A-like enzyme
VRGGAIRRLFWAAAWLAIVLIAVKAYYLGVPAAITLTSGLDYLRSLAAISYVDVLFAAIVWAVGRALLALTANRRWASSVVTVTFTSFAGLSCLYAVANVAVFGVLGGFLTYPLLALAGNVRMLSSSVTAQLTPRVILALIAVPLGYVALVETTVRFIPPLGGSVRPRRGLAFAWLGVWLILGQYAFSTGWTTRQDRQIADNPQWVLVSSWWQAVNGEGTVRMTDRFPAGDLDDFAPLGGRVPSRAAVLQRISRVAGVRATARRRPPNVIIVVLESVAARWASLNGGLYDSTPNLKAESAHGLVADNFYAHIGRSSNSLAAILLSKYPKLGFRDLTEEYPQLPGTSLASVFHDRGYRTGFVTPSDLAWAGWSGFLQPRGFEQLRDYHGLPCSIPISSWGVEDRCMVDGMIAFINEEPSRPFFLMAWTTQTHHPYEPTPGVPLIDMEREPGPDQYDLGRYLNVLHETDRHLERLFETIRRAGLDEDTLIVVVGDHGQAFGYPHNTYIQGRTVYEEDVHVPLMFWFPRLYRSAMRSKTVGGHVDLAPTIAALAGLPAAPDWQGRSLLDTDHPPRAYFYVAEDHFTLGVREDHWKYIFDLREGVERLYDLDHDPDEQRNLAMAQPERCARLRQRLAAWTEANRRQYGQAPAGGT